MNRALPPLLTLLLATSAGAQSAPRPAPAAKPASSVADLLKEARKIQRTTSRLRGLRVRRKIKMGVLTRQQLEKKIRDKMAEQYTDQEIQAEAALLKRLGLLPAELDLKQTILDLLTAEVAGFYDPFQRQLFLASWIPLAMQRPALAHEICHALQDQHFRLKRFVKPLKSNSDKQLAGLALVEGDCTGVMMEYLLAPLGRDLGDLTGMLDPLVEQAMGGGGSAGGKLARAPRFLRETLLFPYLSGVRFIQKVRQKHAWRVVNRCFKRPPESTEQVLHYEKYWARERPVRVQPRDLPALTEGKLQEQRRDVLGELILSIYLKQGVSGGVARRAAEGWGGDLLVAYVPEGQAPAAPKAPLLLVHLTTWDSEADALEFANAQRHVLTARGFKPLPAESSSGLWVFGEPGDRRWSVQLHGRHVLTLAGAAPGLLTRLQREVWERWRVGGRKLKPPPAP